jgi:hypothetical protein
MISSLSRICPLEVSMNGFKRDVERAAERAAERDVERDAERDAERHV